MAFEFINHLCGLGVKFFQKSAKSSNELIFNARDPTSLWNVFKEQQIKFRSNQLFNTCSVLFVSICFFY